MKGALAPASKALYRKHWAVFQDFLREFFPEGVNVTEETWLLFITFLHTQKKWAPSTIAPALSAISYVMKLSEQNSTDFSKSFGVKTLMKAMKKTSGTRDTRHPITLEMLEGLVRQHCYNNYDSALWRAVYSVMFFALLRIGEVCLNSPNSRRNILRRQSVEVAKDGESVSLTMTEFKHSTGQPLNIVLARRHGKSYCPVENLHMYLNFRGTGDGCLFEGATRKPITRGQFIARFQRDLMAIGRSYEYLKAHSFRIGGACYAAESGLSDAQIRRLGRWSSNAFLKYLRAFGVSG